MNVFELVAKLVLDSSEYDESLNESEEKASSFGDKMKGALATGAKVGGAAIAAAGTAAAAFGKQLVSDVGNLASYGDNIDKMSQKLGISAEAYQEWDAIMQHSGTSIESMSGAMKTMALAAENGSDSFKKLGISQKEVESLSQEDLFSKVITGLQNMEEGSERTALATSLLGRGAIELGALLNTSAEDTEAMRQKVHELGGVMSDDAVKSAAAYQDALQDMQTAMTGMKNGILADFLPSFKLVMDGLTEIFGGDSGSGVELIKKGIESIGTKIGEQLPVIVSKGTQIVTGLLNAFISGLPAFLDTGFKILGQVIQGISNNLPQIIQTVIKVLTQMLSTLIQRLPEFLSMGIKLIGSLIKGIIQSIPTVLSSVGQLVSNAVKAFTSFNWVGLGKSIIDGVVSGLVNFGGAIANTLGNLAKSAFNGVKRFFGINSPSTLMRDQIGKFIPEGIAVGIEANADSVAEAMDDLASITMDSYNPQINGTDISNRSGLTTSNVYGGVVININTSDYDGDPIEIANAISEVLTGGFDRKEAVFA